MSLTARLFRRLKRIADSRPPDFIIGGKENPYLRRWWVIPRNRFFNIYLHHFLRSDDDRALHNHPWLNASLLLDGDYIEVLPGDVKKHRRKGAFYFRLPSSAHRVQLFTSLSKGIEPGHVVLKEKPVWTLFITGPRVREWGFLCPQGFRHWKEFTSSRDKGEIGRGCD